MEETLQFEMLQPRWFSIFEIDVDIKTCDCITNHVVVPGAQCTACMEALCTGNNHDLYALVNVIFYVFTIFNVTNAERYKKCSTGLAVAQLTGGLQVFSFLTNIVELGV